MARLMQSFISRTAWVRPTKTARLTMLWPMLSSAMPSIRATAADVPVVEPVPGVELQSRGDQWRRRPRAGPPARRRVPGPRARRHNGRCAARRAATPIAIDGLDLAGVGVDEQADLDARVAAIASTASPTRSTLPGHVEAPSVVSSSRRSGTSVTWSGRTARAIATIAGSTAISRLSRTCTVSPEQAQVAVLDVPAVLAEMDGDPVGPAQLGQDGRPDRVGLAPAPGLAQRGDMIDVHTQA